MALQNFQSNCYSPLTFSKKHTIDLSALSRMCVCVCVKENLHFWFMAKRKGLKYDFVYVRFLKWCVYVCASLDVSRGHMHHAGLISTSISSPRNVTIQSAPR